MNLDCPPELGEPPLQELGLVEALDDSVLAAVG
jgi:hypothetical protein